MAGLLWGEEGFEGVEAVLGGYFYLKKTYVYSHNRTFYTHIYYIL